MFEQLSTVYLLHFQCCEIIFQSSFTVKFCWRRFLWDICSLFIILSPFMPVSSPSFSFSGLLSTVSPAVAVKTFPWPAIYSITPFILCSIWISFLPFSFHFFTAHFSLLPNSLSWLSPFVYIIAWVYHWETRRHQNCTLCCPWVNWVTDAQWPITDRFWKKWWDWSPICVPVIYVMIYGLKS